MEKRPVHIRPGGGGRIAVHLPYTDERVGRIKTVSGLRWEPDERCWTVPWNARIVRRLRELFSGDQVKIDPALLGPLPRHPGQRPALSARPGLAQDTLGAMESELKARGRSPQTVKIYATHVKRLLSHTKKPPQDIRPEEVRAYLKGLEDRNRTSASYHAQAVSAIRFLYKQVLKQPDPTANPRQR